MDTIKNIASFIFSGFGKMRDAWTHFYWGDITPSFGNYLVAIFVALSLGVALATMFHFGSRLVAKRNPSATSVMMLNGFGTTFSVVLGLILVPGLGFYVALGLACIIVFAVAEQVVIAVLDHKRTA